MPTSNDNEKAPDYRVTAGGVEFGEGWLRAARESGAEYLSIKLDDPSFTAPVYAALAGRAGRAQADLASLGGIGTPTLQR